MYGIDVSQHQGVVDWNKVKPNIDFAILRLGWIGNKDNHQLDIQFERNYSECKRLGIPIGIYVYCYSASEDAARVGANWTIQRLQGKDIDLPVYIDMEDNSLSNLGRDNISRIVYAFDEIIENAGYWAGLYANAYWFNNLLNADLKTRFTTWIAHYTNEVDKYKGQYDMWQNSSTGRIDGINGNVDTNYMYRDILAERGRSTSTSASTSTSTDTSQPTTDDLTAKSVDELAHEVIAGKLGYGEDRKRALGNLYDKVQARVNELLGHK